MPALLTALVGVVFLIASVVSHSLMRDPDKVARLTQHRLSKRLAKLDGYAEKALAADTVDWLGTDRLPEDMVIYRYKMDTLQSWAGNFFVNNDDIRAHYFSYQRLNRPEYGVESPLADIPEQWSTANIGPKWYVVRLRKEGVDTKVLEALELSSISPEGQVCDVNQHLSLPDFYTLSPLAGDGGVEVCLDGAPVFLISCPYPDTTYIFANSIFRWIGLAFIAVALFFFLYRKRTLPVFFFTSASFLVFFFLARYWGSQMTDTWNLFSPSLYAGGPVWSSLGDLILIDFTIIIIVASVFLIRRSLLSWARRSKGGLVFYTVCLALLQLLILAYIVCSICSLVNNSSISFEFVWFKEGVFYTVAVLVSFALLFGSVIELYQMMTAPLFLFSGRRVKASGAGFLLVVSVVAACLLFFLPDYLGFRKEQQRVNVWANRLAVDRDLGLELQLRSMEGALASDQVLAMLSASEGAGSLLENRIQENYMLRFSNEYVLSTGCCAANDMECMAHFSRRLSGGVPIADGSRFLCIYQTNGKARYAALFTYVLSDEIVTRLLVELVSASAREDEGYNSVYNNFGKPGSVNLPEQYSYSKYVDSKLVSYKGTYPYPTVLSDKVAQAIQSGKPYIRARKAVSFINVIDDNEQILITRRTRSALQLASSGLTVLAVVLLVLFPYAYVHRRKRAQTRNSFRRRINIVLTAAITVSLVSIAAISIKFVFDRNEADSFNMMSSRISTIQNMVEHIVGDAYSYEELMNPEFRNGLMEIAATTKADISLYTPDGRVFVSTVSEVFDRMMLSTRLSREAYNEIVNNHQRIYIAKETFEGQRYNDLYAPVFNANDDIVAIVASPMNSGVSVMKEAVPHAVLMFILVLTLLFVFAFASASIVSAVFAPLTEVSRNMEAAGVEGLKRIDYHHDDEISGLIESYNRMVYDLEESTRKMAENERDMAWSEMARQVAHEIKNPLTPMKLAVQRLVRLKAKDDPSWTEKFDDLSKVVLDQIDILTDTANDFSTFAKLYTEDPVEVNLDTMLKEQMVIFDNKENIEMVYLGMPDAVIMAPRPQLVRVIVNLITNSIQAIEINQKEVAENGGEPQMGRLMVSLRNSHEDGFYDIVIEDNGPGVSEENQSKLFTPKFTTKSSGTGLGLAMSRNIITKCGGEISYMKSFAYGGAAFQVRLPKKA